jgi:hypothetical protein
MVGRLAWLPFGRNPFLYSSDGIRNAFGESAAIIDRWTAGNPVGLRCYSWTSSAPKMPKLARILSAISREV